MQQVTSGRHVAKNASDIVLTLDALLPEEERLRPEWIVSELAERDLEAKYLPEVDEIIDHLVRSRTGSDVALIMSNGGFGGIWDRLLARLKQTS